MCFWVVCGTQRGKRGLNALITEGIGLQTLLIPGSLNPLWMWETDCTSGNTWIILGARETAENLRALVALSGNLGLVLTINIVAYNWLQEIRHCPLTSVGTRQACRALYTHRQNTHTHKISKYKNNFKRIPSFFFLFFS